MFQGCQDGFVIETIFKQVCFRPEIQFSNFQGSIFGSWSTSVQEQPRVPEMFWPTRDSAEQLGSRGEERREVCECQEPGLLHGDQKNNSSQSHDHNLL